MTPSREIPIGSWLKREAQINPSTLLAAILALAALGLGACEPAGQRTITLPGGPSFVPVAYSALPGWTEDRTVEALPALVRSCRKLLRRPPEAPVGPPGLGLRVDHWHPSCRAMAEAVGGDDAARAYFERWFVPYAVQADTSQSAVNQGKITGYFEIELNGSAERSGPYQTPIYGLPYDLEASRGSAASYATRAQIEDGAGGWQRRSEAPVVLWAEDPVDVFFLHVQGSGRVRLPDGQYVRLGYAGDNGHKFVAIGRLMLDRGLLTPGNVSMQSIRAWLRAHPYEARTLMAENPRYIFFRIIDGDGPIGAQGVPLTPARSLAVDRNYIPLGAPLWVVTNWPGERGRALRRLMMAQDTGAAIRGVGRGDFFWGTGEDAALYAGRMNEPGRYFLLLPRRRDES